MSDNDITIKGNNLEELLNEATDLTDDNISYITNIRFRMTNNEMCMDLYRTMSDPKDPNKGVSYLVHRIIIPPSLARSAANIMLDLSARWEETFGVSLPLTPLDLKANEDEK